MTDLEPLRRTATADCWSDLEVDTLLVAEALGEAPPTPGRRGHLDACPACQARVAALRRERERFADALPVAALAAQAADRVAARRWFGGRWHALVAVATAAVGVGLLLVRPTPGERVKGSPSFAVVVKRGERVFPAEDGAELRPGDRLRFLVSTDRPRSFAVFSVESSGDVSALVPADGDAPLSLTAGSRVALEGSVELDDARGREQLVGVFCPAPFSVAATVRALRGSGGAIGPAPALGLDPDCTTSVFTMNKP